MWVDPGGNSISRCVGSINTHQLTLNPPSPPNTVSLWSPGYFLDSTLSSRGRHSQMSFNLDPLRNPYPKFPSLSAFEGTISIPGFSYWYWFPLLLYPFSNSSGNLGRTGVCAHIIHQTQRFQILLFKNWTLKLKNNVWIEGLLNRCIFSSFFTSIFWIEWIPVIILAIFSIHISRNCEKIAGKGNSIRAHII